MQAHVSPTMDPFASQHEGIAWMLSNNPTYESYFIGFRVASIPEPSTLLLSLFGLSAVGISRRRKSMA